MNERKQKGLCFWCGAKYHVGHKCVKGKLYQVLLNTQSDGKVDEFQKCIENLEDPSTEEQALAQPQDPVVYLHAIKGSQDPHTVRFETFVGNDKAIVLMDSSSTHNFMDLKLVNKLSLSICPQEKLKVIIADGKSLMTNEVCKNVLRKHKVLSL